MSQDMLTLSTEPDPRERQLSDLRFKAADLTKSKDWASAERAWRELLTHTPDSVEHAIDLADVLRRQGRFVEAEALLQSVSHLAAGDRRFLLISARTAMGATQTQVAIQRWRQMLHLDPECFEAHLKIALSYNSIGDLAAAGAHFSQAQRLSPFHPELRRPMAAYLVHTGQLEEAALFFNCIVQASPLDVGAHTTLAEILLQLGQVSRADYVLGADRPDVRPSDKWLSVRIRCDIALQRWSSVLSHLQLWLKTSRSSTASAELVWETIHASIATPNREAVLDTLAPMLGPLLNQVIECARNDYCYETGLALLSRCGNPQSGRSLLLKARLLTDMRRYESARDICSRLQRSRLYELQALRLLVEIFVGLKSWNEAYSSQQRIIDLVPEAGSETRALGNLHLKIDRFAAADDCALKALQLNPYDAEAIALLGSIAYRRGNLHEAISFCKDAISLAPDNAGALFQLAQCYLALEDREQAIASCWECLKVACWHIDAFATLVTLEGTIHANSLWRQHVLRVEAALGKSDRDWAFLAEAWIRRNNPARAIEVFARMPVHFRRTPTLELLRAHAFRLMGEYQSARDTIEKLLAVSPFHYRSFDEYLQILSSSGDFAAADAFISANPDYFRSLDFIERGLGIMSPVHFALGRFSDAFSAYRHSSLSRAVRGVVGEGRFAQSLQQISEEDQTVVLAAWGLGDEINWSRLYPTVAQSVPKLSISCSPRLYSILQRSYPSLKFFPSDRWIGLKPLLSASHVAKYAGLPSLSVARVTDCAGWDLVRAADKVAIMTDLLADINDMFVPSPGYLLPDPQRVAFWRGRLSALSNKPKIGIAWSSLKVDHHRKPHLTELADWHPVLKSRDFTFICLEPTYSQDYTTSTVPKIGQYLHKMEGVDLIDDLENTAALISALDLVVCVANGVSELAAALGVPTWVLNRSHTLDWRFANEMERDVFQLSKRYCSVEPRADTAKLMAHVADNLKTRQFGRHDL